MYTSYDMAGMIKYKSILIKSISLTDDNFGVSKLSISAVCIQTVLSLAMIETVVVGIILIWGTVLCFLYARNKS